MSEGLRQHLPVVVVVSIVGIATGAFALAQVRQSVASLDVGMFSALIILIPSAVMLVGSFVIMLTSHVIERQIYLAVLLTCLATGLISLVVTAGWTADASVVGQLVANSEEGAAMAPLLESPVLILRDVAAYVVAPTVGSILGAWMGSRMHPMKAGRSGRRRR